MMGIAVIGVAGRFPGALNLEALYRNLAGGRDSVGPPSRERLDTVGLPPDADYRPGGYLEGIDRFDPGFFGISPAEARTMEPNQRLLLEITEDILASAGYDRQTLSGSNTPVFVSEAGSDYYKLAEGVSPTLVTGNGREFLASRLAAHYDLRGVAAMVNTSCSSGLAAVHFARNQLLLGEADTALVCSVHLNLYPFRDDRFSLNLLSGDGKSRAFSADANGMSRGEMAGGVLLKPLDRALADGDIIHAVIRGSALNNNAARSTTLTTPNSRSLAEVCTRAWQQAEINPEDIGFIEAHGSGTQLGDGLEIEGLTMAFEQFTDKKSFCALSTIKSNTGHGVFSAGMAGLIKTVLTLKKGELFPTLHFDRPNPVIDFDNAAIYVNRTLKPWTVPEGKRRIAGVTSIGFSGTNCHMILEEAPIVPISTKDATLIFIFCDPESGPGDCAVQYAHYRLLEDRGISTPHMLGTGTGGLTVDVISGDMTLDDARAAASEPWEPPANLAGRVDALVAKQVKPGEAPVFFIDLCPGGALGAQLERKKQQDSDGSEGSAGYRVFRVPADGAEALVEEILRAMPQTRRQPLPPPEFERRRCWIRDGVVDRFFQLVELPAAAGNAKPVVLTDSDSHLEEKIARLWADVLDRKTFSPTDDFFESGGDSLKATRIIKTVNDDFDLDLSFEDIFDFPTIRSLAEYISAEMDTLRKLTATWKEVLKLDTVDADSHFFRLGGHSLLATQVILAVKKEFGLALDFEEIFKHPTPGLLAAYLDRRGALASGGSAHRGIPPVEAREYYATSFAQQRMYLQQELDPAGTSYNTPVRIHLEGDTRRDQLERALQLLVRRHDVLRSFFEKRDNDIWQRVCETVDFRLEYDDLTTKTKNMTGNKTKNMTGDTLYQAFVRPFDPGIAPLMRAMLVKTGPSGHLLFLDMHHIITDAASMRVIAADFAALYGNRELEAPGVQYKDFAHWQNRLFNGGELAEQEAYWLSQLGGDLPDLPLPYDFPVPDVRDLDQGDLIIYRIGGDLRDRLRERTAESGTTLYMYLLSVYYLLLFKYTGRTDIIVGSTVTGRTHPDLHRMVGMFVNMIPMRARPTEKKPFSQLLEEVKETALGAYRNQDYPFDRLVRRLGLGGDRSGNQLFTTEFAVNNAGVDSPGMAELNLPGLKLTLPEDEAAFAKFELHFQVTETGANEHEKEKDIRTVLRYSTQLFKRSTVERLKDHYLEILEQVTTDPGKTPADITLSQTLLSPETRLKDEVSGDFDL